MKLASENFEELIKYFGDKGFASEYQIKPAAKILRLVKNMI